MSNVIQANELKRSRTGDAHLSLSKVERFNKIVKDLNQCGNSMAYLYFDDWGYTLEDVQWMEDAGYHVYRNCSCLWWEVSWK
jgi:hypothetical protein